ncbi:MAG: MMPL family transporter [Verrucomicrobia bacterium]|nr:MMPL family transporter [Verrucomicrobiota bacterium]
MPARRWPWILLTLLVAAGLFRLRFDTDVLALLPESLPAIRGLRLQQRHFAASGDLLITLRGADPEAVSDAAAAVSRALESDPPLTRKARWRPPWQEHPEDAAENLGWLWLQQPPEQVRLLVDRLAPARVAQELAAAREELTTSLDPMTLARTSYDPLGFSRLPGASEGDLPDTGDGVGLFTSGDGLFRVVFVEPPRPDMNYRELARWLAAIRTRADTALASIPGADSKAVPGFTGRPAFIAEIASGMERDLTGSILATILLIAGLFWIAHRSWRPLGWLVISLAGTLVLTLALGGLLFGTLNVLSVGFAAVLLGLAVDYGLVAYQEAAAHPGAPPEEVRRAVSRGVWYSAGTTAGTFLLLGFAGLPGLARLGQLTAIGLLTGAVVMLYFYLPRVCPVPPRAARTASGADRSLAASFPERFGLRVTAGLLLLMALILGGRGLPAVTATDDPLRPRVSPAYEAMEGMQRALDHPQDPLVLVWEGSDPEAVARQMGMVRQQLESAKERGAVEAFELPDRFWPRPDHAAVNHPILRQWMEASPGLRDAVLSAGFNSNAVALLDRLKTHWTQTPAALTPDVWPTNATAAWLRAQSVARTTEGRWLALGAVFAPDPETLPRELGPLPAGTTLGSWTTLSRSLVSFVQPRVGLLFAGIAAALTGCLWMAFGRGREVVLGLAALALSFALLLTAMSLLGWTWNLLSLVALPLLLGISVDSTIHVQLALQRHQGEARAVWRTTGRALLLCAGANIAGFGSLAWSSNRGLASLDLLCAVGVGCVFAICVGLLPAWWRRWAGPVAAPPSTAPGPSALYGPAVWRLARVLARVLPDAAAHQTATFGGWLYPRLAPERLQIVAGNLRPVVGPPPGAAEAAARRTFHQFARKLVDLWRREAGVMDAVRIEPGDGWQHFTEARKSGRGVLLVTPHLGNWELGADLLKRDGIRPLVLTAPEPGDGFTELRAAARRRLGVDTLVVGSDPFAFVEVIRRLQDGGMVALLMDRPPAATAVKVTFLGRPFLASVAAAELARASGAVVLPVIIVREGPLHRAHALAPVDYDRRALGNREERIAFTGRILRAFESAVRQFSDQWFHFVPVWPSGPQAPEPAPPAEPRDPSLHPPSS